MTHYYVEFFPFVPSKCSKNEVLNDGHTLHIPASNLSVMQQDGCCEGSASVVSHC